MNWGDLQHIIIYNVGTLFNTGSHFLDLVLWLNSDAPAEWVQGHLPDGDSMIDGDVLAGDPQGEGTIQFANGVKAHVLLTGRSRRKLEAICSAGTITAFGDGSAWQVRKAAPVGLRGRNELQIAEAAAHTPNQFYIAGRPGPCPCARYRPTSQGRRARGPRRQRTHLRHH